MADNLLKERFGNFMYLAWDALGLPDPSTVQLDIADWLQYGDSGDGSDNIGVTGLRGVGKTYITAAFAAFELWNNPDLKIMCVSMNGTKAMEFIQLTRNIIGQCPLLAPLVPRKVHPFDSSKKQLDSAYRFEVGAITRVAKDPSVQAFGINSGQTGSHVGLIIADDIETLDNSATADGRDKIWHKITQEWPSIMNPESRMVFLGTPHVEDSLYNRLQQIGITFRRWPARCPELHNEERCKNVSPMIIEAVESGDRQPGDPVWDGRFGEEILQEKEALMGTSFFNMQFLLDTTLSDLEKHPLKLFDLIVMTVNPNVAPNNVVWGMKEKSPIPSMGLGKDRLFEPIFWEDEYLEYTDKIMFLDPKGRGKDKIGWFIGLFLNGMIFIPEGGGYTGGYDDETLQFFANKAKQYGVRKVIVEPNFGDGMYKELLTPHIFRVCGQGTAVEDGQWASSQKERRIIATLEPALQQHRIIVDPKVVDHGITQSSEEATHNTLQYQLTRITKEKGCLPADDIIDALAGCVHYFTDKMSLDAKKRAAQYSKEKREAAVREILDCGKHTGSIRVSMLGGVEGLESVKRARSRAPSVAFRRDPRRSRTVLRINRRNSRYR